MGGYSDGTEEKGLAFLELSAKDRTVQHLSNSSYFWFSFACSLVFAPIEARVRWGGSWPCLALYRSLGCFSLSTCPVER